MATYDPIQAELDIIIFQLSIIGDPCDEKVVPLTRRLDELGVPYQKRMETLAQITRDPDFRELMEEINVNRPAPESLDEFLNNLNDAYGSETGEAFKMAVVRYEREY